jgi:hypothetical protein
MKKLAPMPSSPSSGNSIAWTASDLINDPSWIYQLTESEGLELLHVTRAGRVVDKPLLAYRKTDFCLYNIPNALTASFREVRDGRGVALVKGLPRVGVSTEEFELMTWVIGLHFGVARPQDRTSAYINQVKDAGTAYRSPTGRGYSSSAELDFHVDGSDIVLLSCYNQAPTGGMSMCTSSVKAFEVMQLERPDLAKVLLGNFPFSRNGEQSDTEAAWISAPLFGFEGGRTFGSWNRNRLVNALKFDEVPPLTAHQAEAIGYLDAVVRRPDLMYCMNLEAGDLQLLSNQTVLHSRTSFEDHADEDKKRTLYRLWLAMPDSLQLPVGWEAYYGTREPGVVRGGSKGHHYDDDCRLFDAEQAAALGMPIPD